MKKNRLKSLTTAVLALVFVLTTAVACSKDPSTDQGETRVLRIATLYGDGVNQSMRSNYTDLFQLTRDNIEIEYIPAINWEEVYMTRRYDEPYEEPDPVEAMTELLEGDNPPDLVFIDQESLGELVDANLLQSLESYITESEFDTSDIVQGVIDGLRSEGNGELYGLAPTFSSEALVYNKDIFDEAGIEYPTDNMTWDDVFNLAERVSAHYANSDEKKFGFAFSPWSSGMNLYDDMREYIAGKELRIFDPESKTMLVDSPEWEEVWNEMVDLNERNIFPEPVDYSQMPDGPSSRYFDHAFLSGRTAMMLLSYNQISEIVTAMSLGDKIEGFTPFAWDVVTYPVHAETPEVGGFMSLDPVMAIPARSQNTEDAWDLIEFVNGEEWARLKSKSSYNLVSRESYIEQPAGMDINLAAFYTLMPGPNPYGYEMRDERYWEVNSIAYHLFDNVLEEKMTVKEALQEWAIQGNEILQRVEEESGEEVTTVDTFDSESTSSEAIIIE